MSAHSNNISSDEALNRLKSGNLRYMTSARFGGDISFDVRRKTYHEGQLYPRQYLTAESASFLS